MDFEKELQRLAEQYTQEGYFVLTHPDADHLPGFAAAFSPQIIAKRADENVIVEVKRDRADLESDPNVPVQAGITNAQPGWRYDLVILSEGDPFRRISREAREPTPDEIIAQLAQVDQMLREGDIPAASVFAWASLEAAMRQAASDAELHMPRQTTGELLRTLYGNGLFTREQFDRLTRSYRLRTEIVHGLIPLAIEAASVQPVVDATKYLLAWKPDVRGVAG